MSAASPPDPQESSFVSGARRIDARFHPTAQPLRAGIVLAHPHPMHGGHMDHPVVVSAAERAAAAGIAALRFDFGGVRGSEGKTGDRAAHLDDVRRAVADLARRVPEARLLGGGFSYGARTFARSEAGASEGSPRVAGLLLIAPATRVPRTPRDFGNLLLGRPLTDGGPDAEVLNDLRDLRLPTCVLVGEHDVVAPPEELRAALPPHAVLAVLPGVNHFFSRGTGAGPTAYDVLVPALDRAYASLLAPPPKM